MEISPPSHAALQPPSDKDLTPTHSQCDTETWPSLSERDVTPLLKQYVVVVFAGSEGGLKIDAVIQGFGVRTLMVLMRSQAIGSPEWVTVQLK